MDDYSVFAYLGKKGILSSLMESPLYFTMQVKDRLKLIQEVGRQGSASELKNHCIGWIKTGNFT
jgi:hypothetical protein